MVSVTVQVDGDGVEPGWFEAPASGRGRGVFEAVSTDQVSSSSSMNVSCGAMMTVVWSRRLREGVTPCLERSLDEV